MTIRYELHPNPPTKEELGAAVDLTDYVTTDGLQIDPEYDTAIEAFRTAFQHTIDVTADDLQKLVEELGAHAFTAPLTARRAMNTDMRYPTSTPPWKRGRK
ncbi:hypothetical protein DFO58_2165 [Arthrobacter sp. AG1021]|uniref:hypothetical protein n=1 Tax=Arthrobacter sp. AG1021 TaxID=2183908 RepID=UPI000EB0CD44|nr:hypothetical protein [Arthrobacter sp. AG1021]RKS19664.1 hypothetical protein DFO58_2165 [Arthrobacter sp. AG1021]